VADPFVVAVILGAINVFCTFLGLYALERFGRRIPLIVGAAGMAVWLIVFATAGTVGDPSSRPIGTLLIVS
jgi:SP family sugar:H+ symporter-like MFS transporter